jgi:hypothetical protein
VLLDGRHLGVEGVGHPGPVVDLDDDADARRHLGDLLDAGLHETHHLVPLTLDVGEHGVGLVRQAALPDEADGIGHGAAHGVADAEGRDGEGGKHGRIVARLM